MTTSRHWITTVVIDISVWGSFLLWKLAGADAFGVVFQGYFWIAFIAAIYCGFFTDASHHPDESVAYERYQNITNAISVALLAGFGEWLMAACSVLAILLIDVARNRYVTR